MDTLHSVWERQLWEGSRTDEDELRNLATQKLMLKNMCVWWGDWWLFPLWQGGALALVYHHRDCEIQV
jgi:hypothetical protein